MYCVFRIPRMRIVAAFPAAFAFACAAASAQQITPRVVQPQAEGWDGQANRPFEFALTGGASWSDNIARIGENEQEGSVGRAGILLGYAEKTRRIETSIDANVAYEHYFDDTFDNSVVGGVDGSLDFSLIPEHFRWFVQENFGQITSDPFAATTPENRENINYFTTGPDFIFQLGSATSLNLSGRYSDTQYETTNSDSQQYGGVIALARQLSGRSTVSLNVTGDKIEFDDTTVNADYDRYQTYVRYSVQGARTSLSVDAGYTTLDRGSQTSDGVLARFSVTRRLSSAATLTLGAGTQFSDSGDLFRDMQNTRGVNLDTVSVIGTSDPFVSRFGSLGYGFSRNRTSVGVSVIHRKEDYENVAALDRTVTNWDAHFSRQLSRVLEFRLFAQLEQERFDSTEFDDDELRAGAYLNWSVGPRVSLRLQYDRFDRDSSDAATDYAENQIGLFATWSPIAQL